MTVTILLISYLLCIPIVTRFKLYVNSHSFRNNNKYNIIINLMVLLLWHG